MEEKFRIGDMEYTIHTGGCPGGENVLSNNLPGANESLIHQWMQHDEANQALRRVADQVRPVNGACDHRVALQLSQEAAFHRLSISRRKVRPPKKAAAMSLPGAAPRPGVQEPRKWWENAARPLGPGCWELDKVMAQSVPQPVNDQGHKLALEIAGTRQVSLQGELMAATDDRVLARYNLSRCSRYDDHRCQISIENLEPDSYRLHLKLQDNRHGGYQIPLDTGRHLPTCPKPTAKAQWPTVLIPLVPRTYKSVHLKRDQDHSGYPPDGFIYIFLDGHLWREVQVRDKGWFADVNLTMEKGKDHRAATCKADRTLLTPYRIDGRQPRIEICYAHAQWSWAQVESLGGMADADTRLQKGPALEPMETAAFPQPRLQPVDLSSYPGFDKGDGCVSDTDQKGDHLQPVRTDLRAFLGSRLPVVYLHDALGIAESLVVQYKEKLTELRQTVTDLPKLKDVEDLDPAVANTFAGQKEAYFRTAVLAYRIFFDPDTTMDKQQWDDLADARRTYGSHSNRKTPFDLGGSSLLRRKTGTPKRPAIFDTCEKELDRTVLENVLQVQKRRELRAELRELKKVLINFLEGSIDQKPVSSMHNDFIGVNAMLADYANLNEIDYGLLWSKANGLFGFLNHEPCSEDPDLDIAADIAAEIPPRPHKDPGYAYLQSLFDPANPLCAMLWPTREQVDHARADYLIPPQAEPSDGSGLFRKGAFHTAVEAKRLADRPLDKDLSDLAGINHGITAHILWVFKNQWQHIKDTKSELVVHTLVRLLKSSGHPALEGLQVVPAGSTIDLDGKTQVVVGAGPARFAALSKAPFMNRRPGSSAMKNTQANKNRIYNKDETGLISAAPATGKGQYTDQPPKLTRKQWRRFWGKAKNRGESIYEARTSLVVMPANCRYAVNYYTGSINSVSKSTIKLASKTLPPVIAVLEMVNFGRAIGSFFDQERQSPKDFVDPFVSFMSLSYYTLDAAVVLVGKKPVVGSLGSKGEWLFNSTVRIFGYPVVIFNAVGSIVIGLLALTSIWDSALSILKDDYDTAAGYAVAAGALTGLAMAKLGMAEMALFAGVVPWAVPLLIVGIIGTVSALMMTDSNLEKWAKHGPFALSKCDRWRYDYRRKKPHLALESLVGELLKPSVIIKYSETRENRNRQGAMVPEIEVSFYTPGYDADKNELLIDVTAQRSPHADSSSATLKKVRGEEDYKQHVQDAYHHEPIIDRQTGLIVGRKYYYQGMGLVGSYRWRVRARHITHHYGLQVIVPPLMGQKDDAAQVAVDVKSPGWVYSDI